MITTDGEESNPDTGPATGDDADHADRGRLSASVRRRLRARFGLFPVYEVKNRFLLGPGALRLRRFENAEVARLRPSMPVRPTPSASP